MDDRKSAQTERQQNRSSSLSLFTFLETSYHLPPWLDYSWLSQHPHLWFCQEPWIHSWLKTVQEEAHHKKSAKLLISSLNALVQSTDFSLKTQPRLVTSYILSLLDYCNCLLMGTSNSVIQPLQKIQNFAARLVLFVITTQHLSWKNCTGFPFQNVLSIKSLVCVSVL